MRIPDIRDELRRLGHTQAELARRTEIDYTRLNGALSGLWGLKQEQAENVLRVMNSWRYEKCNIGRPRKTKPPETPTETPAGDTP